MNKQTTGSQLNADIDDAARQINGIKQAAIDLAQASAKITEALDLVEDGLRGLQAKSFFQRQPELLNKMTILQLRLERLREFKNMMELGSWQLTVNRDMDDLWRGLP